MGEANRRGSFDERKAQAQRDNAGAFKLIERGEAPHYAFIIDRSPKGLQLLGALKKGPDEVRERVGSPAVQLWEASHFPYVVIWGTWGWSGGLTVQALDLQNLLAEGLPAVVARTLEKGGLCTFLPGVDDAVLDQVLGRIAELQPSTGSA